MFKYEFVANLPLSLPVKEFGKSINIWGSYGQEFSVLFFDSQCSFFDDSDVELTLSLSGLSEAICRRVEANAVAGPWPRPRVCGRLR